MCVCYGGVNTNNGGLFEGDDRNFHGRFDGLAVAQRPRNSTRKAAANGNARSASLESCQKKKKYYERGSRAALSAETRVGRYRCLLLLLLSFLRCYLSFFCIFVRSLGDR